MGEFYGEGFSDNTGMGQSGVSTASGFQINNLNPALWVRNRFTTLDIGLIGQYKDITSGSRNQRNAGGNLGYVSLAFPVHPRWVIGVSIKPYSFVDYGDSTSRQVQGTGAIANYFTTGKGGLNKASITNSVQINRYLSLGLETSYFFGNVRKATEVSLPVSGSGDYLVSLNERTTYSDIAFRAGAAVRVPLKKNKVNLNLGGAYSFGANINSNQTTSFEVTQNSFPVLQPDTLSNNLGGILKTPNQFQAGASLEWPLKFVISADYNRQYWSQYRGFAGADDNLRDVGRINVGAEWLPKFTSLKYLDIVRYRIGFSYGSTPYMINNRDIKDASVSLGITFPMGRGYQNLISFAFVGGQRGGTGSGLIRERYGRVVLGITLLERWFQKQKID
ncbi:hypothetical protein HWI92_11975 [Dyadobacter sandarakinus]|uniref:Long-chain fatty acid transport protein n=2 Tax=Dyadobacter sandarakinus TaxID=2747268 RepID=A0ABX7IH27_9BACT|nr:hypothetical protein HWI92_11975 [Dyadobacter sandarakinus]